MGLIRTASGLRNAPLFYKVNIIVYVEGGRGSLTSQDVFSGGYYESSPDISFWKGILEHFLPKQRFHVKAVGGKSILRQLAAKIKGEGIPNTVICRDRDYDHKLRDFRYKFVIRTLGYSWENDVISPETLTKSIKSITGYQDSDGGLKREAAAELSNFYSRVRWVTRREVALHSRDQDSLLRALVKAIIQCKKGSRPRITLKAYSSAVKRQPATRPRSPKRYTHVPGNSDCNGHLLGQFCYHLYRYHVCRHLHCDVPMNAIEGIFAGMSADAIRANSKLQKHYRTQLRKAGLTK